MHRQVLGAALVALAAAILAFPPPAVGHTTSDHAVYARVSQELTGHGSEFVATLSESQRRRALFPLDAPEREEWHFRPRTRPGVSLDQLGDRQLQLGWSLMERALSEVGYDKARSVIVLEGILGEITGRPGYRDPENYAFVFFGTPTVGETWGWRFEGHHLSLSFTVFPDNVVFTPAFYGTNPAVVPDTHERGGWRVLRREHDLAFDLIGSLSPAQRRVAIISATTPGDIITGPGREASLRERHGIPLSELSAEQQNRALRLITVYLNNIGEEFARQQIEEMESAGIGEIFFAWAGSTQPGASHYYRFHGPTMIIEYDATQANGNHVHSVWHDPRKPLDDVLLRHHGSH